MDLSKKISNFAFQFTKLKDMLQPYIIDIAQLENKSYSYTMQGENAFFDEYVLDSLVGGSFTAQVELHKTETMLTLDVAIEGVLQLVCDRSLDEFEFPFSSNETLHYKFSDHAEELSDELELISKNTTQLSVKQDLYEIIGLAVPMKKLHPRYAHEEFNTEGKMVYSTMSAPETIENKPVDPRWAALEKLKNNESK
jgi:uncharacterized metal-binding protein YceD (DUF177 family)